MTTSLLVRLPSLNISKISDKARKFFEQANAHPIGSATYKAARKKANQTLAKECANYVKQNNVSAENIGSLSSQEIVFLYQHLQYSDLKNKEELNEIIHNEMFDRLLDAQDKMDDKKIITVKDKKALMVYFKTYLNRLKKVPTTNLSEIEADNLKYYPSYIEQLKKYQNTDAGLAAETKTTEIVHPNIKAMRKLGDKLFEEAEQYDENSSNYRKLRKNGNLKIRAAVKQYIADNIKSDTEFELLKTNELVFLHKNLRLGKEDIVLADKLEAICQSRLKAAEIKMDNGTEISASELMAFAEYCSYRQKDWKSSKNKNVLLDWYWLEGCASKIKKSLRTLHMSSKSQKKQNLKQTIRD